MHTYKRTHAHTDATKKKSQIYQTRTRTHTYTRTHTFRSYCGSNAANWNTKKNVMDALKASVLWGGSAFSPSTSLPLPPLPLFFECLIYSFGYIQTISRSLVHVRRCPFSRPPCDSFTQLHPVCSSRCRSVKVRVCIDIYRRITVCLCIYMIGKSIFVVYLCFALHVWRFCPFECIHTLARSHARVRSFLLSLPPSLCRCAGVLVYIDMYG